MPEHAPSRQNPITVTLHPQSLHCAHAEHTLGALAESRVQYTAQALRWAPIHASCAEGDGDSQCAPIHEILRRPHEPGEALALILSGHR